MNQPHYLVDDRNGNTENQRFLYCNHYRNTPTNNTANTQVVLIVPPCFEESNYSRRAIQHFCSQIEALGIDSYQPDLHGTGDSSGELSQTNWQDWLDDLRQCIEYLSEFGYQRIHLLTIRLGTRLMSQCHRGLSEDLRQKLGHWVFWQPVWQGIECLQPMLRAHIISSELRAEASRFSQEQMIERLKSGAPLEVAGYQLSSALGTELVTQQTEDCEISSLTKHHQAHWIEIVSPITGQPSKSRQAAIDHFSKRYSNITIHQLQCEHFWSSPGVQGIEALTTLSTELLQ